MRWLLGLMALVFVAQPLAAADQQLELTIGGHVALATLRAPDAMTDTPLVVITHGTLAHKDMETVQGIAKALQARGIASLAHNLTLGLDRRKGMYDCATKHDYLMDDAVQEIDAWVAEAAKRSRRVYVVGHSRGGNQVARYLTAKPDAAVRAAVLVAPATASTEIDLRGAYARSYGAPLAPLLDQASQAVATGHGGEWMTVPGFIYCRTAVVSARAFLSFYRDDPHQDTAGLVARLNIPVLVLAAARDTTVPDVEPSFAPLAARQGSKIRVEVIDDADHFFRDLAAEDAADRIAEFVKQVP